MSRVPKVPVNMKFPPDLVEKLDAMAAAEKRSRTVMVEVLVEEAIAAREARGARVGGAA